MKDLRGSGQPQPLYQRVLLTVGSLCLTLVLCEIAARLALERGEGPFSHNPVIQKQAQQVDLFEQDSVLGHRLKDGKFVGVYQPGLISFEQIVSDERRKGRRVILNLGDSSTSGWDSNVVVGNAVRQKRGQPLHSPFQNYQTYSDLLAKDESMYVVNAGVPGFSSLQGLEYLERLLSQFKNSGIQVSCVTIYFGNNDSAWNGNIADKYLLPGNEPLIHLMRVLDQSSKYWRLVPRVRSSDYERFLAKMSALSSRFGSNTVIIEPVVPRTWPPGLRATGLERELDEQMKHLRGTRVGTLLSDAQQSYARGMLALQSGDSQEAERLLLRAEENDYLVPRTKNGYRAALHRVVQSERMALVSVGSKIPLEDSGYFIDYCHPIEPANRLIAAEIIRVIRSR